MHENNLNLPALKISKVVSLTAQADDFDGKVGWPQNGQVYVLKKLLQTFFVGYREFIAALFTTTRNDFAAVFGCHAATEPVCILALPAGRLIGTFHRLSKWNMLLSKNGAQR